MSTWPTWGVDTIISGAIDFARSRCANHVSIVVTVPVNPASRGGRASVQIKYRELCDDERDIALGVMGIQSYSRSDSHDGIEIDVMRQLLLEKEQQKR